VSAIVGKYVVWTETDEGGGWEEEGTITDDLGNGFLLAAVDEGNGLQRVISLAATANLARLWVFNDKVAARTWLAGDSKRVLRLVKGENTR
jgi:hypothetical protein